MDDVRFLIAGDHAMVIEFGNEIDTTINVKVLTLINLIKTSPVRGIIEAVPTFRSVMIYYNPKEISYHKLKRKISKLVHKKNSTDTLEKRVIEIPVCYDAPFGEDMNRVSEFTKLDKNEIIQLHSEKEYLIYMLGFLPGFAYLGGLNERLHTPRLPNPRIRIPSGSVGIGGEQTGIYPLDSPGGWNLIGATPIKPFNLNLERPILYQPGDYIQFVPINLAEYDKIVELVSRGEYQCLIREGGLSDEH